MLEKAGKLADVLGSYAQGVQVGCCPCFVPTACIGTGPCEQQPFPYHSYCSSGGEVVRATSLSDVKPTMHMPHAAAWGAGGMTPHDSPVASPAPLQANFPVADATVLSSGGRARTAAAANVGTLAGEPMQSLLYQHPISIWLERLDKLASRACQLRHA